MFVIQALHIKHKHLGQTLTKSVHSGRAEKRETDYRCYIDDGVKKTKIHCMCYTRYTWFSLNYTDVHTKKYKLYINMNTL